MGLMPTKIVKYVLGFSISILLDFFILGKFQLGKPARDRSFYLQEIELIFLVYFIVNLISLFVCFLFVFCFFCLYHTVEGDKL